MLGRYLILIDWNEAIASRRQAFVQERTGLRYCTRIGQGIIWTSAPDLVLPLPDGSGAVIGTLFARHGPAFPITMEDKQWQEEMRTGAVLATLRDRYWGGYILHTEREGMMELARDPGGAMPCYFLQMPTGWAASSDVDILVEAGLLKRAIAWDQIPRYLIAKDLPNSVTAIEGLHELLPGTSVLLKAGEQEVTRFWSPWDHVRETEQWDSEAAAERLRRTIDHCIASWASTSSAILSTLSGGLDSSIVTAGLSKAGTPFQCVTLVTENRNGDERDYARAMASSVGAPLLEGFYDHGDIDLSRSVARHFPKPIGQIHEVAYHALVMRLARGCGADAVHTGNGGDNIFYNSSSVRPFFDCIHARGIGGEAFTTLRNIAKVTETSFPTAAWEALRAIPLIRRPYRWVRNGEAIADDVMADLQAKPLWHPWLDEQLRSRPGKSGQIAFLLRVQNHLEGYLREHGMPMVNPLMSQPVVEAALAIPTWKMLEGGRDRAIARRAYHDRLPPLVRDRRRKGSPSGFAMEVIERNHHEVRERLLDGELIRRKMLNSAAIEAALARGPAMGLSYVRLLTLLDMEAWIARWNGAGG